MNRRAHQYLGTNRSRSGLTIVELLAATVLSVLLITAVLGVLKTVTGSVGRQNREAPVESWQMRLREQLNWDLTNSRQITPVEHGFELAGFAGRNLADRAVLHCRSVIRYRLIEAAGHSCLIREEVHPDSLSRDNQTRELVCTEIHGIVVTSPEDGAVTLPEKVEGFFVQVPEGELPTQLNVALYGSHPDQADFSYGFMLR